MPPSASRARPRYPSPHSSPCACMPFTRSNALGKLRIVTACGIGGAPLTDVSSPRSTPSHSPDTNLRTSPADGRRLTRCSPGTQSHPDCGIGRIPALDPGNAARVTNMARPVVYGPAGSTYVWSVRLGLAEKGVAHELVELPFGAHREEPHLQRHPFAKVPAFEHDGFQLYETQAI